MLELTSNCNGSATFHDVTLCFQYHGWLAISKTHNHGSLRGMVETVQAVDTINIRAKATTSAPSAFFVQEVTLPLTIHNTVDCNAALDYIFSKFYFVKIHN